jgi:hypothetical protein
MRGKLAFLTGYGLATLIEFGVLTTVLYHLNKLLVWLEITTNPMQFYEAFWISVIVVLSIEVLAKIKGRMDR